MVVSILIWVAVAAVVAYVGWPLFRSAASGAETVEAAVSPLERQKLDAYAAIKESEFDRQMGKLSDEDFATLTQRYREQALAAIAGIDEARRAAAPARKSGRSPVRFAFCPSCGVRLPPRANFCSGCGRSLRDSAA